MCDWRRFLVLWWPIYIFFHRSLGSLLTIQFRAFASTLFPRPFLEVHILFNFLFNSRCLLSSVRQAMIQYWFYILLYIFDLCLSLQSTSKPGRMCDISLRILRLLHCMNCIPIQYNILLPRDFKLRRKTRELFFMDDLKIFEFWI